MRKLLAASLLLLLAALASTPALADSIISFNLSTGNSAVAGYPSPYVGVKIDLSNSTTATITFTALSTGGYNYYLMDGGSTGVNVNASSFTLSSWGCTSLASPFSTCKLATGYTQAGGSEDGFGNFNLSINMFDGFDHASSAISFTLTNNSGTWASAADVLAHNSGGFFAAAHIGVCKVGNCSPSAGALATGYAATTNIPTPEPASLSLMGFGLLGLGSLARRKRR